MDDKISLDQEFEDKMNDLLEELVQLFVNHDHDLKNFAFLLTSAVLRGLEEKFPTNEFAIRPHLLLVWPSGSQQFWYFQKCTLTASKSSISPPVNSVASPS